MIRWWRDLLVRLASRYYEDRSPEVKQLLWDKDQQRIRLRKLEYEAAVRQRR